MHYRHEGQGLSGVTLGARSFELDADGNPVKGVKRHPDIGNNVVIYAGATILGGDTYIGDNCVIGGNVWLTHSVDPCCTVYNDAPALKDQERLSSRCGRSPSVDGSSLTPESPATGKTPCSPKQRSIRSSSVWGRRIQGPGNRQENKARNAVRRSWRREGLSSQFSRRFSHRRTPSRSQIQKSCRPVIAEISEHESRRSRPAGRRSRWAFRLNRRRINPAGKQLYFLRRRRGGDLRTNSRASLPNRHETTGIGDQEPWKDKGN